MKGIIIIGHGSRNKEAQNQFMEVVEKVREKSGKLVEGAFMELAKPGFFESVEKLVSQGITNIAVYPLFLFSGIHIKEDIPELIREAEAKYQSVTFKMSGAIGPREELVQIVIIGIEEL